MLFSCAIPFSDEPIVVVSPLSSKFSFCEVLSTIRQYRDKPIWLFLESLYDSCLTA